MVLHIVVIHRPNFEENGSIFEDAMNEKAFHKEKQGERGREMEIGMNLKMMPHVGGEIE